jgi:4-carboxymuconolactone decarboxylase
MSYDQKITLGGLFDIGLSARREVLGAAYVDKSLQATNDFMMAFQHITTEWCWVTRGTGQDSIARPAACLTSPC